MNNTNSRDIIDEKRELRKRVITLKRSYSSEELEELSERVIANLSELDVFKKSKTVLLYYSMPDEVNTEYLIKRIAKDKQIILPIVDESGLILKKYESEDSIVVSKYGIKEPTGDLYIDFNKIDMVVVPGVAFDYSKNRMGRGKGYYDGLLPKIEAPRVAICFDFQMFDNVPSDENDVKMDIIVCESEIIL